MVTRETDEHERGTDYLTLSHFMTNNPLVYDAIFLDTKRSTSKRTREYYKTQKVLSELPLKQLLGHR